MKKRLVLFLVGAFMCLACFGEGFCNGMSSGGFWIMRDGMAGGYGEWSFPLRDDSDGFLLRDCINIGGFGSREVKTFGGGIIGDKLLIGGTCHSEAFVVRSYGFVGAGFGMFGVREHKPYQSPFLISTIFGGGIEFQYSKKTAFVVEFGGDMDFIVGEGRKEFSDLTGSGPILMLGFRSYY